MIRKAVWGMALALLLSVTAAGQTPEQYLDVFNVKVKPEKRAQFDAIAKKIADANRQNKGDTWVTLETAYGEGNAVRFISTRGSYADIDKGFEAFFGALNKAFGKAGTEKIFQDFSSCTVSSQSEIRRRRWDLSSNVPADAAARSKVVGEARWVRTVIVRVRPGHRMKYEEQMRAIKAAQEKAAPKDVVYVSESVAGEQGTVYYISWFRSSLGGFDGGASLLQLLGEGGYEKLLKVASESVQSTEVIISRILPELSNPPEDVASVAPAFWRPKPAAAKPAAAKAPAAKKKE